MNNKATSFIILSIIIISLLVSLVSAATYTNSPKLKATLISQSSDPVEPGEMVTLKFKIENEGKQTTNDVLVIINPKEPFQLYGSAKEVNLGKLRASTTGADGEIVEFKLKVDENAVEAETEIELELKSGNSNVAYFDNEFLVDIRTRDALLEITSINYVPEQIAPGQTGEVKISIKNLADSAIKDIKFDLDFSRSTIPLAPYQSTSQRQIPILESNHQLPFSFKMIADPTATPGLYKVPLNISFTDEQGSSYLIDDVLAITIGEAPKVRPYIKKSDVFQNGKSGKITLEIANAGTSKIKFLELSILPSDEFQLVTTSNYFYIGDVDSDDTDSEEISIYIDSNEKVLNIPLQLKYYDANNKIYEENFNLPLQLYSTSKLKKLGLIESNGSLFYIIILIVLIVVAFLLYKKQPKFLPAFLRKK
ncbi:COG1361 S-layer family protein [Candidatus Woesearchaeota archaeon]|nr:COG1361 S-layer family protein [Candidatus Woesearchaeota archaeon]